MAIQTHSHTEPQTYNEILMRRKGYAAHQEAISEHTRPTTKERLGMEGPDRQRRS